MNIALIGYGKMGKAIEDIAIQKGHEIILRISAANMHDFTAQNIKKADVAIEFTNQYSAPENIIRCMEAGVPVVCGSTGWLFRLAEIKEYCNQKSGAFLYASNFSIGMNLFFELNSYLSTLMSSHPEYDVLIEETHHTKKKDAPSGTAITLAEQVLRNLSHKKQWTREKSDNADDLQIMSKRIDPAAGTHKIKYFSSVDDIEIIHTAHNRKGFAAGALLAAEFLRNKKGIFSMKDVLASL